MPHFVHTVCSARWSCAVPHAKHDNPLTSGLIIVIAALVPSGQGRPKREVELSKAPYPPIEPRPIIARFPEPRAGEDVVAVSRSMTPALVLEAYRLGIFPWPVRQGLVPWASPDPRAIFPLERKQPWPRTVKRSFRPGFRVSFDEAFGQVMRTCGEREGEGT